MITATPSRILLSSMALACLAIVPAWAQLPTGITQTIPDPGVSPQSDVREGSTAVAISGNLTAVGAPSADAGALDSGVVKIYDSTTGALVREIANPDPHQNALFGTSVAINGSTLVVGAQLQVVGGVAMGAVYVYDLTGPTPGVPTLTINNPTGANDDRFGWAVAISGTRIAVGALNNDIGGTNAGRAYVFDLASGTPSVPVKILGNPVGAVNGNFGKSLSFSGNQLLVGAPGDLVSSVAAGRAFLYDVTGSTSPIVSYDNPTPHANDAFGAAVSLSGSNVIIGATKGDAGTADSGSVYGYHNTSSTLVTTIQDPAAASSDQFGFSVAVDGDRLVVGANLGDSTVVNSGTAYIFDLGGGSPGTPVQTLNCPQVLAGAQFGTAVAISGTSVAVTMPLDSTFGPLVRNGATYLYDLGGATPTNPVQALRSPEPASQDHFGNAVALSGSLFVVGSPADNTGGAGAGRVFVFDRSSPTPLAPIAVLATPTPASNAHFGTSVAISDQTIVVGAPDGAGGEGAVYVFNLGHTPPTTPVAILSNPTLPPAGKFGTVLALSGSNLVVGAPGDDSGAVDAGSVYVYDLSGPNPASPVTVLHNPTPAASEGFGSAVAIEGARIAVGAPFDDTGASDAGTAYVYDLPSTTPLTFTNPAPTGFGNFGSALALSGNRFIVGAPGNLVSGTAAGSVFYYDLNSPAAPAFTFNNPEPAPAPPVPEAFGYTVALSGTNLLVSAPADNFGAGTSEGTVYGYDLLSLSQTPQVTFRDPTPMPGDFFGIALAFQGDAAVVGAYWKDDAHGTDRGTAFVLGQADVTNPVGGTFALSLALVKPTDPITATFADWTDASLPLSYSVREGANVIVAPGASAAPAFVLPEGEHHLVGRVSDSAGNFIDTPEQIVVVDGTGPVGGTFAPAAPVVTEGSPVVLNATGWTDPHGPVTYVFGVPFLGGVFPLTAPSTEGSTSFPSLPLGEAQFMVIVSDALGNSTVAGPVSITVTPAAPAGPTFTTLYAKDGEVPNSAPEGDPRIQAAATWTGFGTPAVNAQRAIAYLGKWKAPAQKTPLPLRAQSGIGIFVNDDLLVKVGDPVPGLSNIVFKSFKDPVIDDAGHVAFIASIKGNTPGVVIPSNADTVVVTNGRNGDLEVLAREGSPAPDTGGALYKVFSNVSIKAPGSSIEERGLVSPGSESGVVFTASLVVGTGSALSTASDTGAWWLPAGGTALEKVIVEGDGGTFQGLDKVKTFSILKPVGGSLGFGRGLVNGNEFALFATGANHQQGLYFQGFEPAALLGDSLNSTALPSAVWAKLSLPSVDETGQNVTLLGSLKTGPLGVPAAQAKGIFQSLDGGVDWEPIVRTGDAAPGISGATFSAFKDPLNAPDCADVAFLGTVKGGGATTVNNDGLWFQPDFAPLMLIAREGDEAPAPASPGAKWKSFSSVALAGGETGPLFTAFLQKGLQGMAGPGGVTSVNDFGLYCTDYNTGEVTELVREGQPLDGKTVKSFSVLKAAAGSAGSSRAFSAQHQVVLLVNFTDRSTGIVSITLPESLPPAE